MTEFTAGNGVNVLWKIDPDPAGTHDGPLVVRISEREAAALREFFQHERDEERDMWRSSKDRTWTAVRRNNTIYFQNEDHERSFHFVPKLEGSIRAWSSDLQALAYEYIEAHPERKPWHAPDAGDHWALHIAHGMALSGDEHLYKYTRWGSQGRWGFVPTDGGSVLDPTDPTITAGRRIWPEDAS